jgi:hypothetical protein
VCAGGGARRRRRLGATGLGRNHEHTSHTGAKRERRAGSSAAAFAQVTLGTRSRQDVFQSKAAKRATHTHSDTDWLCTSGQKESLSEIKIIKKKTSIASSSSSCLVAFYSSFLFLFVSNYFSLSSLYLLSSTHTHTHTRHLMPFVDSPRLLVLTISPFHLVRFLLLLLFHRATTYSIYLSISIL